ncbi:MAG TPA: hypothetical protein VLI65_02535, partial [Pyrinomonadaceae bacterium]|nr:hypothetical protein [Pyrinomonadaceae bacterium]
GISGALNTPAAPPAFTTLQPGQFREIEQNLQINIVFVGYRTFGSVNRSVLLNNLPHTYRTINRYPSIYKSNGDVEFAGNKFNFTYNIVNSTQAFDNAYFGYLSSIAVPKPRTVYQELYNQQPARRLNVGQNYQIDSTLAERWLAENAETGLGVNTRQNTVFFVNWFGRSDFKFHVYAKPQVNDIDTGVNIGQQQFVQTIAGGGTLADEPDTPLGSLRRVWFYDLSAGPDYNSRSWDLTVKDVDGDGFTDWRIPPIWEYGNLNGYRPFNTFSVDHYLITRFIAIDLLFTASPLFRVSISPPKLPSNLEFDVSIYEGNPARSGIGLFSPTAATSRLSALQPFNHFSTEVKDLPFDGGAKRAFDCNYLNTNCYGNRFPGNEFLGDLYIYHNDHLFQFLDGDADYEIPAFAYATTDDYANGFVGGSVLDNYRDGTQTMILLTWPESYFADTVNAGTGFTSALLHEAGHHLGLSHPHDGWDSEFGFDFGPGGSLYFVWAGDSSSTLMGYLFPNQSFSQFDRDNMARWFAAAYLNQSNTILPKILASPRADEVSGVLADADARAANALSAYQSMDYVEAAATAKEAYTQVLAAAASINVPIEKQAWQADDRANGHSTMFGPAIDDFRKIPHRQ